jgi:hypothetical protein
VVAVTAAMHTCATEYRYISDRYGVYRYAEMDVEVWGCDVAIYGVSSDPSAKQRQAWGWGSSRR